MLQIVPRMTASLLLLTAVAAWLCVEALGPALILPWAALQTLRADALLSYTRATAVALLKPATYRDAVLKNAQDVRAAPVVTLAPEQPGIEVEVDP